MNVSTYTRILSLGLTLLLLAACSAEDGDLTPPNATYNGGATSPTASTSVVLSGTMDPDAVITAEATTTDDVVINPLSPPGTWECTVSGMIEGSNVIIVSATDLAGNTRLLQVEIVVDLTGPVLTVDQYPQVAAAGLFAFAGTFNEAGSTVMVEVFDSGGISTGITGPATVDANIWDVTFDLSSLGPGDYTVVATGTDRLGNVSATPAEQLFTLDSTSPALVISAPAALPVILNTDVDQQLFAGTAGPFLPLAVTPSTTLNQPDLNGDWDASLSGIPAGKTIVTFDLNTGSTIQKVLVVRDQTAPTVVAWSSANTTSVTIEFNESMNAATIEPENLVVAASSGTELAVLTVTPVNDRMITFTTEVMPVAEAYTATLQIPAVCPVVDGCTVEDARGNSLSATYVWRFNK